MNILGNKFVGYFFAFFFAKFCLFTSSVLVARNVEASISGNYFLVLSIAGVISSLTSVTVGKFSFKYIEKNNSSKSHDIYFKELNLFWVSSNFILLLFSFFSLKYMYHFDKEMIILSLVFIYVYSLSNLMSWYLRLYKKDAMSQLVVLVQPLSVCCLMAFPFFSDHYVELSYDIIILTTLLSGFCALLIIGKRLNLSVGFSIKTLDLHSFKYFFLASFSAIWLNEIDNLMIPFILGVNELSSYKLAFTYSSIMLLILTLVGNIIPRNVTAIIKERDYTKLKLFYFKSVKITALLSTSVSIFIAIVLSIFSNFFFATKNQEALLCFYVLQACFTLVSILGVVSFFAIYVGLEKLVANNIIAFGLVNVIGNFFLIPEYGILGAAISTGGTTLLSYVVLNYHFIRRLNYLLSLVTPPKKGESDA